MVWLPSQNSDPLTAAVGSWVARFVKTASRNTPDSVPRNFLAVSRRPERSIRFKRSRTSAGVLSATGRLWSGAACVSIYPIFFGSSHLPARVHMPFPDGLRPQSRMWFDWIALDECDPASSGCWDQCLDPASLWPTRFCGALRQFQHRDTRHVTATFRDPRIGSVVATASARWA